MLIFGQIEDLKSFFDDDGDEIEGFPPDHSPVPPETDMLLLSSSSPMSKQDILKMLPPRPAVDCLVRRYFGASSPTQSRFPSCAMGILPLLMSMHVQS